jgi:magnesium transporter
MDDDGDMAEMYLTEKMRMEAALLDDDDLQGVGNNGFGSSLSAPVSPVASSSLSRRFEKELSFARSRQDSIKSFKSSVSSQCNIEELEMLLEAYFVVINYTLSKLTWVHVLIFNCFHILFHICNIKMVEICAIYTFYS